MRQPCGFGRGGVVVTDGKAPSPTAGKRTAEDFRRVFDAVDAKPFPALDKLDGRYP